MRGNSTATAPTGKPAAKVSSGCQLTKPEKPYPDFPLFAHATKRWAKKIRGAMHYFGPWDDPDGALERYLAKKDDLHAGRKPKEDTEAVTIKYFVNQFLNAKAASRDAGEITSRTWEDYKAATDLIIDHFGKTRLLADVRPDDFATMRKSLAKKWGPVTLANASTVHLFALLTTTVTPSVPMQVTV